MALLNYTQQAYYSNNDFGNYQFVSLEDIINQFLMVYVGEDKIIPKAKRVDVAFHAQRALAELSFDTLKSCKAQEITVPASLQMILPQDYVNYTKISSVDSAGIKHILYPTSKTSNPTNLYQNDNGDFRFTVLATFAAGNAIIDLNGSYPNIVPGMRLVSPLVTTSDNFISLISTTAAGNTQVVLTSDPNGGVTSFVAIVDDDVTVEITNADGSLIKPASPLDYTANDITGFSTGDSFLTVSSADAGNIQVGMLVVGATLNAPIPPQTFVAAVNGTKITISNPIGLTFGSITLDINFIDQTYDSDTWSNYKSQTPSENNNDDYEDDTYWPMNGQRYGLDPQHAQANGSFYIDCVSGKIHFSSNISGKTVILDYISDSLGTDGEMQVHKFAEEAMYKWISHAILSGRANIPEYQVNRFKKERFAAIRTAKLRLSNLKLEELTQILRGKSKQIKH